MLKQNLIANYMGLIWSGVMGIAFLPVYIHYIGIESYGIIGLFGVITSFMNLLDIGMTPTLGREMARFTGGEHTPESIRDILRSVEIITFGIATLIAIVIILSSNWLASSWLQAKELPVSVVSQAFNIMGVVTALRFIETIYRSSILGLQRQVLFNTIKIILATMQGLGSVAILAWISPTLQAFFVWQGFISIVTLITLNLAIYNVLPQAKYSAKFSWILLKSVWSFARGMIGITFLSLLLTQIDKILLSKILNLNDYGYYTLALTVAGMLNTLVAPVVQAWFPLLTQLFASQNLPLLIKAYHEGAQLVTILMGSAALVLIIFSDTFLQLWTQNHLLAESTAPLLSVLVLGNMLNGFMWIPYHTQLAYGWTSLTIRSNAVAIVFVVPAILLATPRYGALGAAWVWVALNSGYILIQMHFMHLRILKTEKFHWYLQDLLYPLVLTVLVLCIIRYLLPAPVDWLSQSGTLALASFCALLSSILGANKIRTRAKIFCYGLLKT